MISNKELNKLLKQHTKHRILSMYGNHFFNLTPEQLERVYEKGK